MPATLEAPRTEPGTIFLASPRRIIELDNFEQARDDAAEVLNEVELAEETLAVLLKKVAEARDRVLNHELRKLERASVESTQAREAFERELEHRRKRAWAKLRRNAPLELVRAWKAVEAAWHNERNKVGGNTSQRTMKKITAYCAACRRVMDEIKALETDTDSPKAIIAKLEKIMASLSLTIPPENQPLNKLEIADDE